METDLSKVIDQTPPQGVEVAVCLKTTFLFQKMVLQAHQQAVYIPDIFYNVWSKFLDVLDHLQNHSDEVEDTETTASPTSTS